MEAYRKTSVQSLWSTNCSILHESVDKIWTILVIKREELSNKHHSEKLKDCITPGNFFSSSKYIKEFFIIIYKMMKVWVQVGDWQLRGKVSVAQLKSGNVDRPKINGFFHNNFYHGSVFIIWCDISNIFVLASESNIIMHGCVIMRNYCTQWLTYKLPTNTGIGRLCWF